MISLSRSDRARLARGDSPRLVERLLGDLRSGKPRRALDAAAVLAQLLASAPK